MGGNAGSLADKIIAARTEQHGDVGVFESLKKKQPALYYAAKLSMQYQFYKRQDDEGLPPSLRKLYIGHREFKCTGTNLSGVLGCYIQSDLAYQIYGILIQGAPTLSDKALWVGEEILYEKGTGSFTPIITPRP